MYYDLDSVSLEKYDNGQLLMYSNNNEDLILVVEKTEYYSVKIAGLPTMKPTDKSFYINTMIDDKHLEPISEETHPEIFFKLGFRFENKKD